MAAATVAIRGLAIADTEVIPEAAVLPATVLRAVEAVVGTWARPAVVAIPMEVVVAMAAEVDTAEVVVVTEAVAIDKPWRSDRLYLERL
jgi:hypothetical protein